MGLFNRKDTQVTDLSSISTKEKSTSPQADLSGDVGTLVLDKQSDPDNTYSETENHTSKNTRRASHHLMRKKKTPIADTAQKSIPYKRVYTNGIIECEGDIFTKCYKLTDTNFRTARLDRQHEMYMSYGDLLNYFTPDIRAQIVIFNKAIDREDFKHETLFKDADDSFSDIRRDVNAMLMSKISEGQNSIRQYKYLVISIKAENIEIAKGTFGRVDTEISTRIKSINENSTFPMNLDERLELLYSIYNQDADSPFFTRIEYDGQKSSSFRLDWMQQLGITTKDMIAPQDICFKEDYFKIDDTYGRALYLRGFPTRLSPETLSDISNIPCNAIISVHYKPMLQDEAINLSRNQMLEVTRNMAKAAKRGVVKGLGPEYISPDLAQQKLDAEGFYRTLTEDNQKAILMTVVVTIFADDLQDLNKYSQMIMNIARQKKCTLNKLSSQQENGFNSCLPLGVNRIWADRLLDTASAAGFIPFESLEVCDPNGIYYGLNDKKNLVMYDRLSAQLGSGLILGVPGSGKSMAAKSEITQAFLRSQSNEIFVIDPQSEYSPLCRALGGQVIRIAPSTNTFCNPFDLDLSPEVNAGDDPIRVKSNYICAVCAPAIGGSYGLTPIQVTIIDRCVRRIYAPYLKHMDELRRSGSSITCDHDAAPTFVDFYHELRRQPEPDAEYIKLAMEKYCIGSYDTFAHRTNIQTNNRFVVYDIKDIGTGMMEMGMQVCLNDIWNRCIANKRRGVRTWIYIDEMYLLTAKESCVTFLNYIWRQIRKFGGIPTGISHQITDFTGNKSSMGLLENSEFMILLNQKTEDRLEIGERLSISDAQLENIKNSNPGQGLLYTGKAIVPFTNEFPKDSALYSLISTNPSETRLISE